MNSQMLGSTIAAIRKEKGMSQKQLAEGICTQGAISQIEKGDMIPKIDTLYYLALRLDSPLTLFIDVFIEPDFEARDQVVSQIEAAARERKHEEIYELIEKLRAESEIEDASLDCYLSWFHTVACYYTDRIDTREAIHRLRFLLEEGDDTEIRRHHLHLRIMNTLAYLHAFEGRPLQTIYYQDRILNTRVRTKSAANELNYDAFLIRVMYNKAKTLYDMGEIDQAQQVINRAINRSIEQENMSMLGQLYYYRGQCLERTAPGETADIEEAYQRALLFFEILNKRQYTKLVWEQKAQYLV
ncbi:helix-turn-helix domain-containing protein [Alkalicoccus luteus]|uniref:Helix-turn-helix transcriptional regulator n=1 Tax=Alkalicoccus luteus TaxID=1237094 RepID=A0A969PP25_9BACI|nr:helix-turn-helix domain-containing protein [Alkalicoccus luteus]NJP37766.1 helix-turn-helix transcriptional regulator [Alkalicoccus luteus]